MDYQQLITFIMEMVGTVAFAASGAMIAVDRAMDIFGVIVLGVTTAVGGGAIRDVILGIVPPAMFQNPIYTLVATIVGVNTGISHGYVNYMFLLVFLGTITGVGGGLLRDIMAGVPPYILVKHIYACASIVGAIVCVVLYRNFGAVVSMVGASAVVILIRYLAAHYRWNLPKLTRSE